MNRIIVLAVTLLLSISGAVRASEPIKENSTKESGPGLSDEEIQAILAATAPAWSVSTSVDSAFGYKDNLLLSPAQPEKSTFLRSTVEGLVWHLPKSRIDYLGFVNAQGTAYLADTTVHHEGKAYAGLEWRVRVPDVIVITVDAQGYYLNQVFDVSDTTVARSVAELQVTGRRLGPTMRLSIGKGFWVEGTAFADRKVFSDKLNDSRVTDLKGSIGWSRGDRFTISIAATQRRWDFDYRNGFSKTGRAIDLPLVVHERDAEGSIVVGWDKAEHLKTTTKAGYLRYLDNGTGYLNYQKRRVSQAIEWSYGRWRAEAEGEASRKNYDLQTIGVGVRPPRVVQEEYAVAIRAERKLSTRWTVFAEYLWERCRSNDELVMYRMKESLLGVRWTWEK